MQDPNVLFEFIWSVVKFAGAIIAGVGVYHWIKAGKEKDPDARSDALWTILGGMAAYAIASWLSGTPFPTI